MNKKDKYSYFEEFEKNAGSALQCAKIVHDIINNYSQERLTELLPQIHNIEHNADMSKHQMTNYLLKDFLPPIEREDILVLSQKIDDVVDLVEEIVINLDIFNINIMRNEPKELSELLVKCCEIMNELIIYFKDYKHYEKVKEKIIEINHLEEVGDELYIKAMRTLYREDIEAVEIMKWKTIYNCFENAFDVCEDVGNNIQDIVLKNL